MSLDFLLKMRRSILTHQTISISSLDIVLLSMIIAYGLFSIPVQLISFNNQAPSYDLKAEYYLTELEHMDDLMTEIRTSMQQCIDDNRTSSFCSMSELTSKMQSAQKMTDSLIEVIRAQKSQPENR